MPSFFCGPLENAVNLGELEGLAEALYRELGYDPAEAEHPVTLARRWLGADAVIQAPATLTVPACTFFVGGQRRIAVKPRLAAPYRRFWIAHELGHALLARARIEFVRSGAVSAKAAEMLGPFAGGAAKRTDVELLTALKAAENALSLVADTGEDEKPRRRR